MTKAKHLSTEQKLEIAERRKRALDLRLAGVSYRAIAKQEGVSHGTIISDVQSALAEIPRQSAEELRQTETERLDQLQRAVWPEALKGNLGAVDKAVKIIDRRARLLGLDAPQQVQVSSDVDLDATAAKILQAAELAFNAGRAGTLDEGDE